MLKVDSVTAYQNTVLTLGGDVLIPTSICPCTGASFVVGVNPTGNQFIIKEPASA